MRLWGRGGEPPEVDDELLPDVDPDEGDGTASEPTLDELDEEQQAIATAWAEKQVSVEREKYATALAAVREKGFDLTDGGMSLRDVNTAAAWLGAGREPAPAAAPAASESPAGAPAAAPNPWEDPEGYATWIQETTKQALKAEYDAALAAREAEITQLKGMVYGRETTEAVGRVVEQVKEHPLLARFVSHPDFAGGMEAALAGATPEQLKNATWLKQAAMWVAGGLDEAKLPAEAPRGQDGRFVANRNAVMDQVQRQGQAANAPSRGGGGRSEEGLALSREDQHMIHVLNAGMRNLGPPLSERELQAAESTTFDGWKAAMDRQPVRK